MISVIVPTYNKASLLEQTLQNILKQTYQNIEIIVVDDGSTDRTREVVTNLQSEKINIHFSTPSKAAIIMPDIENEKIEKVLMLVMPVMLNQN